MSVSRSKIGLKSLESRDSSLCSGSFFIDSRALDARTLGLASIELLFGTHCCLGLEFVLGDVLGLSTQMFLGTHFSPGLMGLAWLT